MLLIVSICTAAASPVGNGSVALKSRCSKINLRPSGYGDYCRERCDCLFIYIYLSLFVWVVVAGHPRLRTTGRNLVWIASRTFIS
jgi:hypothetical protein